MAVFAQGGGGHDGDAGDDGGVRDEVAEGGVVGAVKDEVVVLKHGNRVGGGEREVVWDVGGVWVESAAWLVGERGVGKKEGAPAQVEKCRFNLGSPDRRGRVQDLSVQVRRFDDVVVDQSDCADPGTGKICRSRTPEAAKADDEDSCALETELAYMN